MKKLFQYASLVIIFVGLLSIATPVHALDAQVGNCTTPEGIVSSGYTQAQCLGVGVWSAYTTGGGGGSNTVCSTLSGIGALICQLNQILNSIVPLLVVLGVVYFVWGVVTYFIAGGEEAKKQGRDRIIYGIIGLAVIMSIWGLVNIVVTTFGVGGQAAPSVSLISNTGTTATTCVLPANPKFQDLMGYVTYCIINNSIIPLIFAVAVVMFIWGIVQYFIIGADEEAKREQGKQFIIWGIIGLAVMFTVWGLVHILGVTFGVDTSVLPKVKP